MTGYGKTNTIVFVVNVCARAVIQVGFAALEVGSVRAKNTKAVLLKNISDSTIGCVRSMAVVSTY